MTISDKEIMFKVAKRESDRSDFYKQFLTGEPDDPLYTAYIIHVAKQNVLNEVFKQLGIYKQYILWKIDSEVDTNL